MNDAQSRKSVKIIVLSLVTGTCDFKLVASTSGGKNVRGEYSDLDGVIHWCDRSRLLR